MAVFFFVSLLHLICSPPATRLHILVSCRVAPFSTTTAATADGFSFLSRFFLLKSSFDTGDVISVSPCSGRVVLLPLVLYYTSRGGSCWLLMKVFFLFSSFCFYFGPFSWKIFLKFFTRLYKFFLWGFACRLEVVDKKPNPWKAIIPRHVPGGRADGRTDARARWKVLLTFWRHLPSLIIMNSPGFEVRGSVTGGGKIR